MNDYKTYGIALSGEDGEGKFLLKIAIAFLNLTIGTLTKIMRHRVLPIQSGNIVFQTEALENSILEEKIHQNIKKNYGFEQKLKVAATTRNWRTTLKLLEMTGTH